MKFLIKNINLLFNLSYKDYSCSFFSRMDKMHSNSYYNGLHDTFTCTIIIMEVIYVQGIQTINLKYMTYIIMLRTILSHLPWVLLVISLYLHQLRSFLSINCTRLSTEERNKIPTWEQYLNVVGGSTIYPSDNTLKTSPKRVSSLNDIYFMFVKHLLRKPS